MTSQQEKRGGSLRLQLASGCELEGQRRRKKEPLGLREKERREMAK